MPANLSISLIVILTPAIARFSLMEGKRPEHKPHSFHKKNKKNKNKTDKSNAANSMNISSGDNSNYSVTATTSKPKAPLPPNQVKKVNNKRAAKKKREKLLEVTRKTSETPLSATSDSSTTRNLLNEMKLTGDFSDESSDDDDSMALDGYKELPTDALILNTETVEKIIEQIGTDIESEAETMDDSEDSDSDEFGEEAAMNAGCQRYFLENSGPKCFNCGESGHVLKDCPATSTVPCNLCGQLGHSRFNCPQEVCYNCSRPGHQSKACPAKRKRRVYDDDLCNRCGQPGHLARECSMSWRGYVFCRDLPRSHSAFLDELRGLRKRCYNCASISHFGDDCPNRRRPNYSVFHIPDYDYLDRVILRIKENNGVRKEIQQVKKEPNAKQKQADNFKKIVNPPSQQQKSKSHHHHKQEHKQEYKQEQEYYDEEDVEMYYGNSANYTDNYVHQPLQNQHHQQHQNRKVFLQSRGINSSDNEAEHQQPQGFRKIPKPPVSFVSYESNKVRVKDYDELEEEEESFRKGSSGNKKKSGGSYRGGYKKHFN